MNVWGFSIGLGLIAAAVAVIAFVRYRTRETVRLRADLALARELRDAANGDAVRLAAVDEFETGLYRRLFYAGVVGPRVRSAAWGLLGLALSLAGAVAVSPLGGVLATTAYVVTAVAAIAFGIATLGNAALAIYHTLATPRVAFDAGIGDGDDDESADDGIAVPEGAIDADADSADVESAERESTEIDDFTPVPDSSNGRD